MLLPLLSFDFDDVLFPFFTGLLEAYQPTDPACLSPEYDGPYDFAQLWACSNEEASRRIEEFAGGDQCHRQPLLGAIEGLKVLSKHYRQIVTTARNPNLEAGTRLYASHHFAGVFDAAHHLGNRYNGQPWESKGEFCRRLGADCHIDDHPDNVTECIEAGIPAIVFGDYYWNRRYKPPVGAAYARDWPALTSLLVPPSGWLAEATAALGR